MDVLISGNVGPNTFQVLSASGVKVVTGAYGTAKEAVETCKSGKLRGTGTSTVAVHARMGRGMGLGKGLGTMQPTPQQPQQMPVEPKAKEEELERLSEIVKTLETDLEEVKSILV
jgi:predicted Fe-Mo cluster-binding NifX family protein